MSNQIYAINNYQFTAQDQLLLDANVWLYINSPQAKSKDPRKFIYSSAFSQAKAAKSKVFIDTLIMSEFVNSYARAVYNKLPQQTKPKEFKEFRSSPDFIPVANRIATALQNIIKQCQLIETGVQLVDINQLLLNFKTGNADFNDLMLAELCRRNNLKLISHDADFQGLDIIILTANARLVNP